MSAPLFRAQHRGDNSKLIHYWIRINIQAANINSQSKGGNAESVKMLKHHKEQKSPRSLTKNPIPSLSYECIIFTGSYSLVSAFCLISVLIFIMIFHRGARAGGSWRAACCFWLFSSLSSGFKIWIWIFMIENNRSYKNKSLQSWAVSYRGKRCLPHQSSLAILASSAVPVKAWKPTIAELVSARSLVKLTYLVQFSFAYLKTKETDLPLGWDRLTCFKYSFTCVEIETSDSICNWQVDYYSSLNVISLDPGKCFKHAGLHLKQVTPRLPSDSVFIFHRILRCYDLRWWFFLEICGNKLLCVVLLLSVSPAGQSDLSRQRDALTFKGWDSLIYFSPFVEQAYFQQFQAMVGSWAAKTENTTKIWCWKYV